MKKISSYQFVALLLCCKLFDIMTYIPEKSDHGTLVLITLTVTAIAEGMLIIPVIALYNRTNGMGILGFAGSKSKTLGKIVGIMFLAIMVWGIIQTMGDLTFFLQYCFSDTYAAWAVIIVISATTLYVAQTGLSALARATGIIVIVTILVLAFIFTGFKHHVAFYELNLAVRNPLGDIIRSAPKFIASSKELLLFVILLDALKSKPYKTAFSYLSIKLVVSLASALMVIIVLGDFVYLSKLPFFTLSAYSQMSIFEHYEAISMLFWTLCAIVKLAVFTICAEHCIHHLFPNLRTIIGNSLTLIITGGITLFLILDERWESISAPKTEALITVILMTAVPLALLVISSKRRTGGRIN